MTIRLAPLALTVLATAAAARAQNDFDLDKTSPARLGASIDLAVRSAPPLRGGLLIVSTGPGPTPLAAVQPGDARVMRVGPDLTLASVLTTSGTGTAGYSLGLPNNPAFAGFELHWQAILLGTSAPFLAELGNDVVTLTGSTATGALAPAQLASARAFAISFVDGDNNAGAGDVLVAGGGTGTLTGATGLASSELWDFRTMRVRPGPAMGAARALHLGVRLLDGRVLVTGGADQNGVVLASCEIYDPATDSFAPTGSMGTPRVLHAACRLADGRVMVAGGASTLLPDVVAAISSTLSSVEIYDPATGAWSNTNALGGARLAPALTSLPNGQVMASGGVQVGFFFGLPISAASTTAVQRWNPATGSWTSGPNMAQRRAGHHFNQVRLADGRILMTGGVNLPDLLNATSAAPIQGAEVYDPVANAWTVANMPNARALHTATLLPDGRVAVCGGAQGLLTAPVSIDNVDLFDPTTNTWTPAPNLTGPRASHVAQLLPDGTLALFGGQGATATVPTVETLRY